MQERIIIHLDMDAFFAAIEERENPQFQGKPLVVGADPKGGKGRGVVSTANYEARKFGIHSALPISQAYKLCPRAIFLPPNFALYSKVSENIMKIIHEYSSVVEQTSLDEAYIDVTESVNSSFLTIVRKVDAGQKWEKAREIAEKMRKTIWAKEALASSCGMGPNKMIAKIACEAAKPHTETSLVRGRPNGIVVVRKEDAERFMENLDVQKIPGIGIKTAGILRSSGFKKMVDLKKLSCHEMEDLFGKRGKEMYMHVRGIDEQPVEGERKTQSIGKETTFEHDTRDPELLIRTFERLAKQVAQELKEQGFACKTITVVCRFSGFETHTKSKTLASPTQDEGTLRSQAMRLFLKFLLEKQKPVRLIGLRIMIQ